MGDCGMTIPNAPPVQVHGLHIDDLYAEAKQILDGAGVQTDEDAAMVAKLLDMLRQAKKGADEQRATEKKPHDDAAKEVQAAWKPLLDKCDLAAKVCKDALAPFLTAKEAAQREEAEQARKAAEEAQRAAAERLRATAPTDLAAREGAEAAIKEADKATKAAAKLDKSKAHAIGGSRAIGLRSYWIAELVDPTAALKHYRKHQPDALKAWLVDQAQRDANAGARAIPGFAINEDRRAA
jgi:hypothetical protein